MKQEKLTKGTGFSNRATAEKEAKLLVEKGHTARVVEVAKERKWYVYFALHYK